MPAKPILRKPKENIEKGPDVSIKPVSENEKVKIKILEKINNKLENKLTTENVDSILKLSVAYKNLE